MKRNRRPSPQMTTLLRALAASAPRARHGYDLMTETGLQSGTLYPLLMRMADQGLVEAEWELPSKAGRPARHGYRLTLAGAALAASLPAAEPDADGALPTWA